MRRKNFMRHAPHIPSSLSRRRVLALSGGVAALGLAGCGGRGLSHCDSEVDPVRREQCRALIADRQVSTQARNTILGGLIGCGAGALVGLALRNPGLGCAVGAVAGAGVGFAVAYFDDVLEETDGDAVRAGRIISTDANEDAAISAEVASTANEAVVALARKSSATGAGQRVFAFSDAAGLAVHWSDLSDTLSECAEGYDYCKGRIQEKLDSPARPLAAVGESSPVRTIADASGVLRSNAALFKAYAGQARDAARAVQG